MENVNDASENNKNSSSIAKIASSAFFLAVLGVSSQVIAITFQIGILSHYGVPEYLAETSIAKSVLAGVVLMVGVLAITTVYSVLDSRPLTSIKNRLIMMAVTLPLFLIVFLSFGYDRSEVASLMWASAILFSVWVFVNPKSFPSLLETPVKIIPPLFLLCCALLIVPFNAGRIAAKYGGKCWIFEEAGKSFAVVDRYGEYVIAVPHDPKLHTLGPGFRLIKMEKLSETVVQKKFEKRPKVIE
jgi:hypothetical protein